MLEWPAEVFYLHANISSYWKWGEQGQEIAWTDGRTIAFLPELAAVIERVANDGLPPLGSLVLLLAACTNNWHEPPSRRGLLAGVLETEQAQDWRDLLWQVCDGLDRVHALPAELRHSLPAKAELAALVFEGASGLIGPAPSKGVVQSLAQMSTGELTLKPTAAHAFWLVRDLAALREGLRRVSAEALQSRLQTSLETLPQPAPLEPPPLTGRAWLSKLEEDDEFSGLARLAKRLLAVIHLPRKLHDADELPLGGVSDIAPRGTLDRLLLSELAHDDLTLAVRIAMNEALYLRRESPPRTPPRHRRLVLDAGLRLWGLPRIFGAAVALAFNAHVEQNVTWKNFRAAGPELAPVMLDSAAGIREHLAALDHRLHPGEALRALEQLADAGPTDECVLVTSADTFADPEFQAALDGRRSGVLYAALVSRDGRFEMLQCTRAGRKRICQAQLPLAEILQPRPQPAPLRVPERGALPAYFHCAEPPLLLPVDRRLENSWHVHDWGTLTVAPDRRLLLWKSAARGPRQLATGLPEGIVRGVAATAPQAHQVCLVVGKLSQRGLEAIWINKDGTIDARVPLRPDAGHIDAIAVDKQVAFLRTTEHIQAVDLRTGQPYRAFDRKPGQENFGLFVRHLDASHWKWRRLTVAGNTTAMMLVGQGDSRDDGSHWQRVFEARGIEGPVAITAQGNIFLTATGAVIRVDHGDRAAPHVEAVSRDGTEFVLRCLSQHVVVRTCDGTALLRSSARVDLESELRMPAARRNLRRRFIGVGIDPQGNLALISPKRTSWTLQLPTLVFPQQATPSVPPRWYAFEPWAHEEVAGFQLHCAKFPDGSLAVLDSRGLLHLRSSALRSPECTIVLCEGATAGWCSDGRMWGPPYFCGDRATMRSESIALEVVRPFLEGAQ